MACECSDMLDSPMTASSVTTSRRQSSFLSGNHGPWVSSSTPSAMAGECGRVALERGW